MNRMLIALVAVLVSVLSLACSRSQAAGSKEVLPSLSGVLIKNISIDAGQGKVLADYFSGQIAEHLVNFGARFNESEGLELKGSASCSEESMTRYSCTVSIYSPEYSRVSAVHTHDDLNSGVLAGPKSLVKSGVAKELSIKLGFRLTLKQ